MNNKQQLTRTAWVTPGNSEHQYGKDNAIEVPPTFPFFWLLDLEGFNRPDSFSSVLENQRQTGPSARTPALSYLSVLLTDNMVTFYWGFFRVFQHPFPPASRLPAGCQKTASLELLVYSPGTDVLGTLWIPCSEAANNLSESSCFNKAFHTLSLLSFLCFQGNLDSYKICSNLYSWFL